MNKISYRSYFFLAAFSITILKLVTLYYSKLPLWVDEAQYWLWSEHHDMGYYSKPPMIAWIISVSTNFFSDSEFGIRFFAPLIHFATSYFVYLAARELFDERTAFLSGISYLFIPAVTFSSFFISADAPLMLFWAMGFYYFVQINKDFEKSEISHWVMLGICYGLGMMSKYTFVAFVFSVFLYYAVTGFSRVFSPRFILSGLLGVAIFLPNVIWNFRNDFVSFSHTEQNVFSKKTDLYFGELGNFVGGQVLIFGMLMAVFFIFAVAKKAENKKNKNILLIFSLPVLIAGSVVSLTSSAQIHWSAPAYISGTILVVNYLLQHSQKWLLPTIILNLSVMVIATILLALSGSDGPSVKYMKRIYAWHAPAKFLSKKNIDKNLPIIVDERKLAAPLFHDAGKYGVKNRIYKRNMFGRVEDYYDMNFKAPDIGSGGAYFITRSISAKIMGKLFDVVKPMGYADEEYKIAVYKVSGQKEFKLKPKKKNDTLSGN